MKFDIVIAGAGIVGLSTAYQILEIMPAAKILILEKEAAIATHQTGHNSGVMHSGIYYKPGSYKAKNCIQGYQLLIEFCNTHQIEYKLIGKLIVATKKQEQARLHTIYQNGIQNGLLNLKLLSTTATLELEPNVSCLESIYVPQAGIIDYKIIAQKLKTEIENKGSAIEIGKKIIEIKPRNTGFIIKNEDGSEYETEFFINCAGLQSDRIAKLSGLKLNFRIIPFKGNYYKLNSKKANIVTHLIYPVPDPQFPFLGIHYTRLINGDQTLGPNAVMAFDRESYHHNSINFKDSYDILAFPGFWKLIAKHWKTGISEYARNYSKSYFAKKASEMTPGITSEDLQPAGCGIRAQVVDIHGNMVEDFVAIRKSKMIHICNAPSPAATAGLSIGKQIANWYLEMH
ncbi:MAG: L-2-hydroxyglutarate oxidase [Saprospiraceae bacterium]|nr:L-2-hydroxyglutarate oxidase [Saprospiraceae bacterium]